MPPPSKRWAILESGATSHFLTTDEPATNIVPAGVLLIARLIFIEHSAQFRRDKMCCFVELSVERSLEVELKITKQIYFQLQHQSHSPIIQKFRARPSSMLLI
jgi:hypothetical protein